MNTPTNTLRIEQRQHQTLTPRLQQAVRLLQLSSLDFAQEVQQAMDTNPFLEEDPDAPAQAAATPAEEMPLTADNAVTWENTPEVATDVADGSAINEPTWERDTWSPTVGTGGGRQGSADGELDLVEMMAADVSLRDHLHGQANVMPLSPRDHALTALIIESLDEDGYMRVTLEEVRQMAELTPAPDIDEMTVALKLVQSLDPSGVGARDVPYLARALDSTASKVEAVCMRIRHHDPRPGWRFGASNVQYVTPDVIVRKGKNNQWITMLNPDVVPKVRLNQMYAELFQQHRDSGHAELAAHLREARWTVRNVEQRFSTILDVADAIVRRQCHFFEYGPLAMKPLGLREIAEELGLHESTVCRVTNNKYMATPSGVFELKYFFSRALPTPGGGAA
jgi:RNA polymerase sigma-54 factor